jgi:hypothetical protein
MGPFEYLGHESDYRASSLLISRDVRFLYSQQLTLGPLDPFGGALYNVPTPTPISPAIRFQPTRYREAQQKQLFWGSLALELWASKTQDLAVSIHWGFWAGCPDRGFWASGVH